MCNPLVAFACKGKESVASAASETNLRRGNVPWHTGVDRGEDCVCVRGR